MALVVNSNVASINAQRQLLNSGNALDQSSERLASGKRINSAADDAAGLAISNRQTSQIRGLDQAIRNANDGVSLIQTAEGALDETTNMMQRMRELAVQSSNGIYSDADRATLDAEVQQLKAEVDRIAETTSFNGQKILDGSLGEVALQIGSQAGETVSFNLDGFGADDLGGTASGDLVGTQAGQGAGGTTLMAALQAMTGTTDAMTINGQNIGDLSAATTVKQQVDAINSNVAGVEVSAFVEMTAGADGDGVLRGTNTVTFAVGRQDGTTTSIEIGDTGSMDELVDKINSLAGDDMSAELDDDGRLQLTSDTGATITVTETGAGAALASTGIATTTVQDAQLSFEITDDGVENVDVGFTGTVSDAEVQNIGVQARTEGDITSFANTAQAAIAEGDLTINDVEIGAIAAGTSVTTQGDNIAAAINEKSAETGVVASNAAGVLTLNSLDGTEMSIELDGAATVANTGLIDTNDAESQGNSIADLSIATAEDASKAIDTIDAALEQINASRSEMGAINNRLDFTVKNLSNVVEKTSAARSQIMDADFAKESAELSRAQVLQQASQAMLAQANARPQQVLSLLQ